MAIIGISGKAGSGKDTVGLMLRSLIEYPKLSYEEFNTYVISGDYNWKIKKFAGKLKQIISLIIGCEVSDLENEEFKNKELGPEWWYYTLYNAGAKPVKVPYLAIPNSNEYSYAYNLFKHTPRSLLQLLGTEGGREVIHSNIWVNALFADYKPEKPAFPFPSDTLDKELPNWIITDVRFINEAESIINLGGVVVRLERDTETSAGNTHPSEIALDDYQFEYYINNNNITLKELYGRVRELIINLHNR